MAAEMTQWVKCLVHKLWDGSLDPQHPLKCQVGTATHCNHSAQEAGIQDHYGKLSNYTG